MWANKVVSYIIFQGIIIIHPAWVIHAVVIYFAKGPRQLSTPLTRCSTTAKISLLSPPARQWELIPLWSGDSEFWPHPSTPFITKCFLLYSCSFSFLNGQEALLKSSVQKVTCWIATHLFSSPEEERKRGNMFVGFAHHDYASLLSSTETVWYAWRDSEVQ